jgi:xanthine dehydrogenase YagT iron-sulfur-binding subunit
VHPGSETAPRHAVRLVVNGRPQALEVDVRTSLLDLLRERLGLTGAKKGCNQGECGACTVHLNSEPVNACLVLAVSADGAEVRTIEGVAGSDGALHPLQQAFIDCDALQCGFCTPGQVMTGLACLQQGLAASPDKLRDAMSGNLCRCSCYPQIIEAIQSVAGT